ncbi:Arm DNA-binding domain-containing protein [Planococcus kocurii]|uniref:Arm DNA-binding domain-containing protein n=1 Tax=Planococcus kocurii TaxID=1374 RepID=UPI003CFCA540
MAIASYRKRGKTWQYRVIVINPYSEKKREYTESGFTTKKEAQLAAAKKEKSVL